MIFSGWNKLVQLVIAPTLEPTQRASRIQAVERGVIVPIKALVIVILVSYFFFSDWNDFFHARQRALEIIRQFFILYIVINVLGIAFLFSSVKIPLKWLESLLVFLGLMDGLLMVGLISVTQGSDSILYWFFPALILHNALTIPLAVPQILLNFAVSFCYIAGSYVDSWIIAAVTTEDRLNTLDGAARTLTTPKYTIMEDPRSEKVAERIIVLLLWTVCCYVIQM